MTAAILPARSSPVSRYTLAYGLATLKINVSTIHALCAAMLQERPIECGVVPGFRTADEAEAELRKVELMAEKEGGVQSIPDVIEAPVLATR